jgi:hypothetical protein
VQAHLHGAWLAQVARSVGGPSARLRTLSWQNRAPVVARPRRGERHGRQRRGSLVSLSLTETGEDGGVRVEGKASVEVRP